MGEEFTAGGECGFVCGRPKGVDEEVVVGARDELDVLRGGVAEDGGVVEHFDGDVGDGGGVVGWVGDIHFGGEEDRGGSGLEDTQMAYFGGEARHVAW